MAVDAIRLLPKFFQPADPDEDLVRAAQGGDAAAFDRLVRQHEAALLGYLYARLLSEEAAREVAQETLLAAWAQIGRFGGRARFKTWLFGIAGHKAADYLRRCATLPRTLPLELIQESDPLPADGQETDPYQRVDRLERELQVRAAVASLPDTQRRIIELYYFGELNLPEIAALLGMNLSTLKYQFYRAHRALRPLVADPADAALAPPLDVPAAAGRRIIPHEL